jgi:butyrate kinase
MKSVEDTYCVLVINPGSTSTKIAVFNGNRRVWDETVAHSRDDLSRFEQMIDQLEYRRDRVLEVMERNGTKPDTLSAVVGRGGVLHPLPGGTYTVSPAMIQDLENGGLGEHASNLGALIANQIASPAGIPAYIVDPVVVDEFDDVARLSGIPEIHRSSIFHALNQKAMARKAAAARGGAYQEYNFIVAHLGGGITVGAHRKGRVVDVNDGLNGDGPFTPERSGSLPPAKVLSLLESGRFSVPEMKKRVKGHGGLAGYLDTADLREVKKRIEQGDPTASLVYQAMAYQTAKEIGAMAAVLHGDVDAIVITGGIAHDQDFCALIGDRVSFIAPVEIYPGEEEMSALAEGALRVLTGQEESREYRGAAGAPHQSLHTGVRRENRAPRPDKKGDRS